MGHGHGAGESVALPNEGCCRKGAVRYTNSIARFDEYEKPGQDYL